MPLSDSTLKKLLLLTLVLLIADLGSRLWPPTIPAVQAQNSSSQLYVEPGVTMLRAPDGSRQVLGKVVIDLHNGNVWGFPTTTQEPYPIDINQRQPPTSTPFRLGHFDFSVLDRIGH